ncbi:MAG: nucleotide exchange factor GrpE [Lachnospiraceae bacterium]|nr:nucleotide exchange factor GrpE [Lachnospiraceae bacterium]
MADKEKDIVNEELEEETAEEVLEGEVVEEEAEETLEDAEPEKCEEETSETEEGEEKPKKPFFKKKDKKDKRDEQIEELTDRVKRQMAEFDNFRKRTEREKAAMFEVGAKSVIEKILPVVDNFERGMASLSEEELEAPFAQGMDKIYKQLITTLEGLDVKPIEAVGKEFDPEFHNAVMHIDDDNYDANIVVEEFQKGYMYRDSVVRHSMVKVAN